MLHTPHCYDYLSKVWMVKTSVLILSWRTLLGWSGETDPRACCTEFCKTTEKISKATKMSRSCPGGHYWDGLVRQCMSCRMVCDQPDHHARCTDFCLAYSCKAVAGQFYDTLLKKCLKCSELCGHHPSECSRECLAHQTVAVTQRPGGVSALQPLNTRRSHESRGPHFSEVLVYSLLGLCLAMLLSTMLVALLVLLRRARGQKEGGQKKGQQPDGHRQTSKDCLMAEAVAQEANAMVPNRPRATETCVHCFADQTGAPCSLYQQAVPQCLNGDPQHRHRYPSGLVHGHVGRTVCERDDALRIICSPTQPSM